MSQRTRLARLTAWAMNCLGDVSWAVWPTLCAACDATIDPGTILCSACQTSIADVAVVGRCERCTSPLPDEAGPCGRCQGGGIRPLGRVACLGHHRDALRDLVHGLKYRHRWAIADHVASRLVLRRDVVALLDRADVIVPVAMHPWRQVVRGFNQAELLSRSLVRARSLVAGITSARPTPLPVVRALRRVKWTASQTSQHSHAARVRNVRDAFELIDDQAVTGRSVLLVDDVMTSGSTLRACARALRRARPTEINAIVLAAADPRHHRDAVRSR